MKFFNQVINISAYALTLSILLDIIRDVTYPIPFFTLIYWAVAMVYLYLAMKAIKQEENMNPEDESGLEI